MKVVIHLPDEVKDRIALTFAEGIVEGSNQAISSVGHCVDVELRWCASQRWDELVVVGCLVDVVDDGCIELHVEVLLTRGNGRPVGHCLKLNVCFCVFPRNSLRFFLGVFVV